MSRRAAIIGGGITGVLTACELRRAGWDVVLLEGAHIGAGSSSRTAAGIRQQFSTLETVRGMRYSVQWYADFQRQMGQSVLQQSGYLFLYDEQNSWQNALNHIDIQKAAGLAEVEALSSESIHQRFPWIDANAVLGATFCPTDGFLFPAVVYGEGAALARTLGVQIIQGAVVTAADQLNGKITQISTTKGKFEADLFFDCTNAWSERTAIALGAEILPIQALKRYLWFIQRDGSLDEATFTSLPMVICPNSVYFRPENAHSLMMGWAHDTPAEPAFSYEDQDRIDPGFSHNSGTDALPFSAWATAANYVPAIGEFAGITSTTSGFYATTPDHNPFLSYDRQLSNLIRLVGFSGHGAMFGPFSAKVGVSLAEAGKDIPTIAIDGEAVAIGAFQIGRIFHHSETMVI